MKRWGQTMKYTTCIQYLSRQALWSGKRARAFTLVEILIVVVILGILATVVVPMFNQAGEDAMQSILQQNLQGIRKAMIWYQADHGEYPILPYDSYVDGGYNVSFVTQLTCRTNAEGNVRTDGRYGPYIRGVRTGPLYDDQVLPPNPFVEQARNADFAGRVVGSEQLTLGGYENAPAGWVCLERSPQNIIPWKPVSGEDPYERGEGRSESGI